MTNGELLERIDGTTKEEIANQAYQFGFDEGFKSGTIDCFSDIKKEFEYLLNSGMGKQKCLKHLIKIADKNIKYEQNYNIEAKIDNKPNPPMPKNYGELKIVSNPKHIIVNGALYEKIDDSVMMIANGYGDNVIDTQETIELEIERGYRSEIKPIDDLNNMAPEEINEVIK